MNNTNLYGIKNGLSSLGADITYIVLFAVLTLLTVLVAVWIINLSIKKQPEKLGENHLLGIMLILTTVGIAIRILFSFLIVGHREEYFGIAGSDGLVWKILEDGFGDYYSVTSEGVIYPFSLYLFSLMTTLGKWFGVTASSAVMPFLIKLPLIIADICSIALLYRIAKKYFNQVAAVAIGGLYALCPIFIFTSSVWGSLFSVLSLLLLLTFYFLVQKKYFLMFAIYSLALLTAKEAIYLFPVIAIFVIFRYVRAIQYERNEGRQKKLDLLDLIKSKDRGIVIRFPLYLIICLAGMYLISLPFIIKDYNANFFIWFNEFYLKGLTKVAYYGYNSLGLYNLFGMNGSFFTTNLVSLFVVLFAIIIIILTLIYFLSRKNRANLVMLAAFVYMTLSIFFIDFRELSAYPVLAILLLSFIFIKDKRLLQIFMVFAVIMVINASVVMAYGGYLNNFEASKFLDNNEYLGGSLLTSTVGKVINIVLSILAVLNYLYFTFILMDITMNHNRKLFGGQDTISPLYSIKHWILK